MEGPTDSATEAKTAGPTTTLVRPPRQYPKDGRQSLGWAWTGPPGSASDLQPTRCRHNNRFRGRANAAGGTRPHKPNGRRRSNSRIVWRRYQQLTSGRWSGRRWLVAELANLQSTGSVQKPANSGARRRRRAQHGVTIDRVTVSRYNRGNTYGTTCKADH